MTIKSGFIPGKNKIIKIKVFIDKPEKSENHGISKFDLNWNARFDELKGYKKRFGNCNVPQHWTENRSLGAWVIRQRAYRKYLSVERIDKLNALGFIWDLYEYWWKLKYEELKEFKNIFGHCDVPKLKGNYLPLAEWVSKQRFDYHLGQERLNPEKINKLNQIGFNWGVTNTPWEKRFNELKEFKSRFGHCRVPQLWGENPPLASWVAVQRMKHKNKVLSPQRFKLLNKLGFCWKVNSDG